ncbi:MAG TPA: hypothetical protein VJ853_14470 [Thermoanaerobaculia bacterium]|nr:hypothetical protein [Thermoanaerobaculia bacterium]
MTYANTSDAPSTNPRTITFSITDGTNASNSATKTINVIAVNDAPSISAPAGPITPSAVVVAFNGANAIAVNDIDAAANPLQVTLTATNGAVTFASQSGPVVTFTGTLTQINASLSEMTFTFASRAAASLQITVNDQGNSGTGGAQSDTRMIAINAPAADIPMLNPYALILLALALAAIAIARQ